MPRLSAVMADGDVPICPAVDPWDELAKVVGEHTLGGEERAQRSAAAARGSKRFVIGPTGEEQALPLSSPHGLRLLIDWLRRHREALTFDTVKIMWPRMTPQASYAFAEMAPALPRAVRTISIEGYADTDAVVALATALRRSAGGELSGYVVDLPSTAEAVNVLARAPGAEVKMSLKQGMAKHQDWVLPAREGDVVEATAWWRFPIGCWALTSGMSSGELNARLVRVVAHRAGQSRDRVGVDFGEAGGEKALLPARIAPAAPPPEAATVPEPLVERKEEVGIAAHSGPSGVRPTSAGLDPRVSAARAQDLVDRAPPQMQSIMKNFAKAVPGGPAVR